MDFAYGRAAWPIADDSDADQNMLYSNRICIGYSLGVGPKTKYYFVEHVFCDCDRI